MTKNGIETLKTNKEKTKIPIEGHISDFGNKMGIFNMALSQGGFVGSKRMSGTEQVREIQGSWGNAMSCQAQGESKEIPCSWDGRSGTPGAQTH